MKRLLIGPAGLYLFVQRLLMVSGLYLPVCVETAYGLYLPVQRLLMAYRPIPACVEIADGY